MIQTRTSDMYGHWESFAKDDPMFYIATWNKDWTVEDFFASGKEMAERIVEWAGDIPKDRMLEIGCGLGRTSVHFAKYFRHVDAIDISEAMISQARKQNPPENLNFAVSSGDGLKEFESGVFDLVFSYIVFQHIPHEHVIASYLCEISRVLKKGGKAALQYDTRPEPIYIKLYKSLPDFMLPRAHRRFIRRYRRRPERLKELIAKAGLSIADERGAVSEEHFFLLKKD